MAKDPDIDFYINVSVITQKLELLHGNLDQGFIFQPKGYSILGTLDFAGKKQVA